MKTPKRVIHYCFAVSLVAGLAGGSLAFAAEGALPAESGKALSEMPVLTGNEWQALQTESKMAFILGVGHVVTIEENVILKHPELKRKGFSAKLSEGLAGVPMDTIVRTVDEFYQKNPDELDLPVMGVIWRQLVRPKLKTGIADQPLTSQTGP